MIVICRQCCHAAQTDNAHWYVTVRGAAIAELTIAVPAPTLDFATSSQCAGMTTARNNRRYTAQTGNTHGYATVRSAAIAELTVAIPAPALDGSIHAQGARMFHARSHRRHLA